MCIQNIISMHVSVGVMLSLLSSTQHSTTFTKKMIEDNSTMDETAQFLGVSFTCGVCFVYDLCNVVVKVTKMMCVCVLLQFVCWEHWQFSMIVLNDLLLEVTYVIHHAKMYQNFRYIIFTIIMI